MKNNILENFPVDLSDEVFETLAQSQYCKIKRIVGLGHATPDGECYEQSQNEFVIVVQGAARLNFIDSGEMVDLTVGDYVSIPAGVKHRVVWSDSSEPTVWLAVYFT